METKKGIAVSPGIAIGEAVVLGQEDLRIHRRYVPRGKVRDEIERLDTAVKEHEVFLNCSATDRQAHLLIRRGWDDMVRDSIAALEAANAGAEIVRQFRERTDAERILKRDARYGDILELCREDWMDRAINLKYLMLNVRVREILAEK